MRDYTGKTVFVGIDVHKKTYSVTCLCEQQIVKRDTLKTEPEHLSRYLNKYFMDAKIKTVYEAGFSGFVLHRHLLEKGINNIVVHAASAEISVRDRVKTDKRDSLKLAMQLSNGRLKGIYVPTPQREAYREVTRIRAKVVKDKCRISRQGRSVLRKTLVQAAWVAIDKDPSLRATYERVSETAGKKRAIVGIARRLIGKIRSCFALDSLYQLSEPKIVKFDKKTGEISLAKIA